MFFVFILEVFSPSNGNYINDDEMVVVIKNTLRDAGYDRSHKFNKEEENRKDKV